MSARRRRLPGRAWLAAGLLLSAPAAWADWARDYDLGMRAIEQGDWAEAERRMRAALGEEADASARKRFQGQRFDRYVPQWYAGLAAYRQGDCSRALDYWKDPGASRVIAGIADLAAERQRLGRECETRLAAASAPAAPPAAATTTSTPTTTQPGAAQPATGQPRVAQRTPPSPTPAPAAMQRATQPAPERSAPPARQASAPARVAAPAELRNALQSWLAGRYEEVARMEPGRALDARARSQLLLLRAAARFVQSELAGNDAALEAARADVRAARQAQALDPDPSLFPPRFRSFVAGIR